jgi:hypothetical protein
MLVTFPTRVKMIRDETKLNTVFRLDLRICVTSGFRHGVDEILALVGIYAA